MTDPAAFGLDVAYAGECYMIFRDGKLIPGRYGNRDSATYRMGNIARRLAEAAMPVIPCLCCSTPFSSEGRHNRLCDDCRSMS